MEIPCKVSCHLGKYCYHLEMGNIIGGGHFVNAKNKNAYFGGPVEELWRYPVK